VETRSKSSPNYLKRGIKMLNSKQRASLRGIANTIDTILTIGKDGVNEGVIASLDEALTKREIVKGKVLESAMLTPREACDQLCAAVRGEPVQVIGTKFVIYRRNNEKPVLEF